MKMPNNIVVVTKVHIGFITITLRSFKHVPTAAFGSTSERKSTVIMCSLCTYIIMYIIKQNNLYTYVKDSVILTIVTQHVDKQ